jgi:hypothetical protein
MTAVTARFGWSVRVLVPDEPQPGRRVGLASDGECAQPEQAAPLNVIDGALQQFPGLNGHCGQIGMRDPPLTVETDPGQTGRAASVTGRSRSKSPAALQVPPDGSVTLTTRPPTSSTAQTPMSASITMLVSRETSAWYGHLHGKGDHPSLLARRYRSHGHRDELTRACPSCARKTSMTSYAGRC